ncbi:helix-turn-helix domain-containing protein [Planomonospora sp. ID82291]|uniref:AlbA family DNA-binding domain-containing protein n=1 Tax=Planomonospora sp. ID82291 TaxID=2738136 RepID=UPI0018C38E67|nr:ATP-binding protein [Planomonospora sp. ID82291]MBG0813802.1 putative DNA binding domain-containing protein [Planomonospora sp. ID82291]
MMSRPDNVRPWQSIEIQTDAGRLTAWTVGGVDFEISSNDAPNVSLESFRDAVFEYLESDLGRDVSRKAASLNNGDVNLCIDDRDPLPWEESPMVFVDFISGPELPFELSVRSAKNIPLRALVSRIGSILEEYGCRLISPEGIKEFEAVHFTSDPGLYTWSIQALCPSSLNIGQICAIRKELNYSSFFFNNSFSDPRAVYELVRAGEVKRILGIPENEWLEVKSAPYEMKRDKQWQCELAEDVARFANSEYGGILILGIRSEKEDGRDVLRKMAPLPIDRKRVHNYHQSLDAHVHPPIERLKIESVPVDGGEVLCLLIPPQPEERKPFLVQGAFFDGKYQRGMISIVRRRGEHSIPVTAREIHAALVAGRALLRGEVRKTLGELEGYRNSEGEGLGS